MSTREAMNIPELVNQCINCNRAGKPDYFVGTFNATKFAELLQQASEPVGEFNEPVAHLWEMLGRWSAYLASNGGEAKLSPPDYLIDAIKNATSPPSTQAKLAEHERSFEVLTNKMAELIAKLDKAREALQFYAEGKHYQDLEDGIYVTDDGELARNTLKEIE